MISLYRNLDGIVDAVVFVDPSDKKCRGVEANHENLGTSIPVQSRLSSDLAARRRSVATSSRARASRDGRALRDAPSAMGGGRGPNSGGGRRSGGGGHQAGQGEMAARKLKLAKEKAAKAVSYTHLTLPTKA